MKRYIAALSFLIILSGCSVREYEPLEIAREEYVRNINHGTEVLRADFTPEFTMTVTMDGLETIQYDLPGKQKEIIGIYVSAGDRVTEGQLMAEFGSTEIIAEKERLNKKLANYQLEIEHLKRLMEIDPANDLSSEIMRIKEDMEITGLYLEEADAKMENYKLVAIKDGVIIKINDLIANGMVSSGGVVIVEASGSGVFTATTDRVFDFKENDVYTAELDEIEYEMKIAKIETFNLNNKKMTKLFFEPVSDISELLETDELVMHIKGETIKDAVYVPSKAIKTNENGYYVNLCSEQGYMELRYVTIGSQVNDNVIILEGLSGGEQVIVE